MIDCLKVKQDTHSKMRKIVLSHKNVREEISNQFILLTMISNYIKSHLPCHIYNIPVCHERVKKL